MKLNSFFFFLAFTGVSTLNSVSPRVLFRPLTEALISSFPLSPSSSSKNLDKPICPAFLVAPERADEAPVDLVVVTAAEGCLILFDEEEEEEEAEDVFLWKEFEAEEVSNTCSSSGDGVAPVYINIYHNYQEGDREEECAMETGGWTTRKTIERSKRDMVLSKAH